VGGSNDIVEIVVRKWDNLSSTYMDLQTIRRIIVNSPAGADTAEYAILTNATMRQNDRIELFVRNTTDNSSVTMLNSSKIVISEK